LDLLLAAQIGSDEVTAGPSFEDHVALIHERQLLVERMEGLEANLQELNSLTTWLSVNLPDAETNPHLANLFKEADKLRDEGDSLVSIKPKVHSSKHYHTQSALTDHFCRTSRSMTLVGGSDKALPHKMGCL